MDEITAFQSKALYCLLSVLLNYELQLAQKLPRQQFVIAMLIQCVCLQRP